MRHDVSYGTRVPTAEHIDRPAGTVYEYAVDPSNLPQWAAGLAKTTVEHVDGQCVADSPMGRVTVTFAEHNDFGILDHTVTLPSGESVYNPLRVIPAGDDASEVVFTLRERPDMSNEEFAQDSPAVQADLESLKRIIEAS